MAEQKDDIALRRAALLKAARSAVRLRHSIAADEELNELIPALDRAFMQAVARGELPDVARMLRESNALHDS
jgi:hypothetical protein